LDLQKLLSLHYQNSLKASFRFLPLFQFYLFFYFTNSTPFSQSQTLIA